MPRERNSECRHAIRRPVHNLDEVRALGCISYGKDEALLKERLANVIYRVVEVAEVSFVEQFTQKTR